MNYLVAPERVETPDFTIRSYLPCDGPLLANATDASFLHLRRFMPWVKAALPPEEAERLAREFRGKYLLAVDFPLAIVSPDGKRFLGSTGFHLRAGSLEDRVAEIGMWIRREEAGKGTGTAVLVQLLRWGLSEWPWAALFWHCSIQNPASIRTAEKAGMVRDGVLRKRLRVSGEGLHDEICFSACRGEWRPPEGA